MFSVNGFYGHIRQHDHRSLIMFTGFLLAAQIVMGGSLLFMLPLLDAKRSFFFDPYAYFTTYGFGILMISALAFIYRYMHQISDVRLSIGFYDADRVNHPELVSLVERVAISAGIKTPGIGIIPANAMNAFACGYNEKTAKIVVTEGLLQNMDLNELEAVIAHEIAHIKNGDIALMAVANASLTSIMRMEKYNPFSLKHGRKRLLIMIFMPVLFVFFAFSGLINTIGMTIGLICRLLISTSREFIADAEAVRLTHKPAALASALRKLQGCSTIDGLDPVTDAMMIDGAVEGQFSTHPTIEERIEKLKRYAGSMMHGAGTGQPAFTYPRTNLKPNTGGSGSFNHARTLPPALPQQSYWVNQPPPIGRSGPKNIIQRVRSDASENIIGINAATSRILKYGGLAFAGIMIVSTIAMNSQFAAIQKQLQHSDGISSEIKPRKIGRKADYKANASPKRLLKRAKVQKSENSSKPAATNKLLRRETYKLLRRKTNNPVKPASIIKQPTSKNGLAELAG